MDNTPSPTAPETTFPTTSLPADFNPAYLPHFTEHILGVQLYEKQRAILHDVDQPGSNVVVQACNGMGKTTRICAPVALWHPASYPNSKTVTTSGVFRQVKDQMWPEIRRLAERLRGFSPEVNQTSMTFPNGSSVIGFSTDDPGKFEGWHAESLLIILDEAKTIPEEMFHAVERCKQGQPVRVLLLSSPGAPRGAFYRACTSEAHLYRHHKVTAQDCPHIPPGSIDLLIKKWGKDHPLVRSMVFAEFMEADGELMVLTEERLLNCINNPPAKLGSIKVSFCDFAAGGDENVFTFREGNTIIAQEAWREKDTMKAVAKFLTLFNRYGLKPGEVYADSGGLGTVMCDALAAAGFRVNRVNNGERAYDDDKYVNRGAEIWFNAARAIERCEVRGIPMDESLRGQMVCRRGGVDSRGRMQLESKREMARRGLSSPDRADSLFGCIACGSDTGDIGLRTFVPSVFDMMSAYDVEVVNAGFNPGE